MVKPNAGVWPVGVQITGQWLCKALVSILFADRTAIGTNFRQRGAKSGQKFRFYNRSIIVYKAHSRAIRQPAEAGGPISCDLLSRVDSLIAISFRAWSSSPAAEKTLEIGRASCRERV